MGPRSGRWGSADAYVKPNGEWSIVHRCSQCGALRANRIAGDDNEALLLSIAMRPIARPFPAGQDHRPILTAAASRKGGSSFSGGDYPISAASTAAVTSGESGSIFGAKRLMTLPFRSRRNLAKFQLMVPGNLLVCGFVR